MFPKSSPVYSNATKITPCLETCFENGCRCTNIVRLPRKKTIQLVIMAYNKIKGNDGTVSKAHHPVHLHGHSFFVLKQGFGVLDNQTNIIKSLNDDIVCNNRPCSRSQWKRDITKELNFRNPPLKDTVVIPAQGYTVVRFRNDNPGFWLFHCHTMFHLTEGMMLLFDETSDEIPKPPPGFPTCSSFDIEDKDFDKWMQTNKDGKDQLPNENEVEEYTQIIV